MNRVWSLIVLSGLWVTPACATLPLKWPENSWPELSALLANTSISPDWTGPDGSVIFELHTIHGSEETAVDLLKRSKKFKAWSAEKKGRFLNMTIMLDRQLMVRALLSMGVSPHGYSETTESPLMTAAYYGQLQMMRMLIKAGAEVDLKLPLSDTSKYGVSALHKAISQGQHLAFRLLVDAGVDLKKYKADELHNSLVELAINGGSSNILWFLVDRHGFDVKQRRDDGHTPLSYAVLYGAPYLMVETMLYTGTDPCLADADGRLPEEIAQQKDDRYDRPVLYGGLLKDACKRYKEGKW